MLLCYSCSDLFSLVSPALFSASPFTQSIYRHVSLETHNGPGEAEEQNALSLFDRGRELNLIRMKSLYKLTHMASGWWHHEGGFLTHIVSNPVSGFILLTQQALDSTCYQLTKRPKPFWEFHHIVHLCWLPGTSGMKTKFPSIVFEALPRLAPPARQCHSQSFP